MTAIAGKIFNIGWDSGLMADIDNTPKGLVERARTDVEAFAYLYRLYYEEVYSFCARRLFDRAAAEDVTASVFLKMVGRFSSFKGNLNSFRYWLLRIASNEVVSYFRKAGRGRKLAAELAEMLKARGGSAENINPLEQMDNNEKKKLLQHALLNLKPRYFSVITMRYFEKMDIDQIATVLGLTSSTVRSRLSRAVQMLSQTEPLKSYIKDTEVVL
jgi:RNA polymerase sigma-70 factor (ECF subfamily)